MWGVLLILALGFLGVLLLYSVHLALDRVCVWHAERFCRRQGLEVKRVRWQMEFEQRVDGGRGIKTEFTLVQLDCLDVQKERRLLLLSVWLFGVRKTVSEGPYPDSYDSQWPQVCA